MVRDELNHISQKIFFVEFIFHSNDKSSLVSVLKKYPDTKTGVFLVKADESEYVANIVGYSMIRTYKKSLQKIVLVLLDLHCYRHVHCN